MLLVIPPFNNFLIYTLLIFLFLYLLAPYYGIHTNIFYSGPATDLRAGLQHA